MTTMSDLTDDLLSEILSRVPITSLRSVRSTCKKWNSLSKNRVFGKAAKAAARNQFLGFMVMDSKVCSLKFDLQGIRSDGDEFFDPSINPVSILEPVEISKAFHCDGLLLCVTKDSSRLLVWNPYLGQTKWIQPINDFHRFDRFALGYDKNRNHKILRVFDFYQSVNSRDFGYEIYGFSSDSWKVLDFTPNWKIPSHQRSVTLKGNAYFFAQEKIIVEGEVTTETEDFLLCFDFTSERFGPRLSLPFHSGDEETVTLFCIRDEKLAVLHQRWETCEVMEIWVTDKIDPNALSWTKFLEVDMSLLTGFPVDPFAGSFFIDEEKKVVVVFDLDSNDEPTETCRRYQTAHIIGDDGYFKSVNIGEVPQKDSTNICCYLQINIFSIFM
ncbi:hypothetical protein EUTSA_v10024142mg [Eutrema salsugineum]|uniref:F-box domain-containing protein n=1 Tax=Eutrema salsugineum TaxID=72664 RepID=V4KDN5_EUTSA|nr:hypothetical protein EUTSA_v10024142mg [Eutrema salsugineum]